MKIELEAQDIQGIAEKVAERLKPLLTARQGEENGILDKKALAEYLRVDLSWVDKNVHALPHFKIGKYVRFRRTDIDKALEGVKVTPSPYLSLLKR